jgi:hypothetical protein
LQYWKEYLQDLKIYFVFNTIIFLACLATAIYKKWNGQDFGIFVLGVVATSTLYIVFGFYLFTAKKEMKILEKQKPKH